MPSVLLPIESLAVDPRLQSRASLDREAVADYAERYRDGADMPPVVVFLDGRGDHWLADGFHRVAAAREAGLAEILADLRDGEFRNALLYAAGANAAHGLRRTNADKRRAVEMLLSDPKLAEWSDNKIAEHCGVSHVFVATVRPLETVSSDAPRVAVYRNKHGGISTMNVANIGKGRRKAAPEPKTPTAMPDIDDPPKPCPFCGNDSVAIRPDDNGREHRAICGVCDALGPGGYTEQLAVFNWNRRA